MHRAIPLAAAALALLASCTAYQPAPISAQANADALDVRRLDDPRLERFIAAAQSLDDAPAQAPGWDLERLTLAAVYYHPQLDIARAKLDAAKAGVVTANQLPNPSLNLGVTYNSTTTVPSPWAVGPLVNFVLETFGKRGYRTAQARALVDAAREDLASATWLVRAQVRSALLDLWAAKGRLALERRRLALQQTLVSLLEQRFAQGDASALDVTRERIRRNQIELALRGLERQRDEARAQLAAAIGIPARALRGVELSFDTFEKLPVLAPDIATGELRRQALVHRSDVQGLLAEYAAAQAALQLQVAGQYPNLTLGVGYTYDQGDNKYTLSPGAVLPVFNQNQGPIAQAEARRAEAAARFTALQARIIAAIDAAAADYRGAERSLATARALAEQEDRRAQQVQRSFSAGALDRPSLVNAQIELAAARLSRLDATVQERRAVGLLEDALRTPLFAPRAPLAVLQRNPRLASEPAHE